MGGTSRRPAIGLASASSSIFIPRTLPVVSGRRWSTCRSGLRLWVAGGRRSAPRAAVIMPRSEGDWPLRSTPGHLFAVIRKIGTSRPLWVNDNGDPIGCRDIRIGTVIYEIENIVSP
jgi:hypothetical protein